MAILENHLLFNHTFLAELTADASIDAAIPFAPRDLHEWYSIRDASSARSLVDSWIAPLFSLLELNLTPSPSSARGGEKGDEIYILASAFDAAPLGILYVIPPGADLNETRRGRFWQAQAVLAARRHTPSLRWAVLSDGERFRLLDAQALRRYEAFLQVDVGRLARGEADPSALRVFFRCFQRTAFVAGQAGQSGLEKLLAQSDQATRQAEKHLKARISDAEGILAQLCLGLVRSTGQTQFSEAQRAAIYHDAVALLYRLLFLLYAEGQRLLPVDNPAYAQRSLARLVQDARQAQLGGLADPQGQGLWRRLQRLCQAIYASDPAMDIPAYNGGLFDDEHHPYLRDGLIADQHLAPALYELAYLPPDKSKISNLNSQIALPIDYRDLSVRHLGGLYEGMIEYQLFVAEEAMLARRDDKGVVHFLTQSAAGGLRRGDQPIEAGGVYFAQSSGERRATGTYYTPEYIVDYIVVNTVIQGLEQRRRPLEEKLKGWLAEIAAAPAGQRPALQRTVDAELLRFIEEQVLTFTICDPAMGSGHFLVNAAHHLANFIVETLCLVDWEHLDIDASPLEWRRRAAERCLYGVDLNPMAVELAKLSLWLATMAQGCPLSFLEHHLRQGNSLIGARLEDIEAALSQSIAPKAPSPKEHKLRQAGQLSMLDHPGFSGHLQAATGLLERVSAQVAKTLEDIQAQEADYEQARAELAPLRKLADVLTARHFGLAVSETDIAAMARYLLHETISLKPAALALLEQAEAFSKQWSFFHWQIEFPSIILYGGFDVAVGNPPYIRPHKLSDETKIYLWSAYSSFSAKSDIYVCFQEQGLKTIRENGRLGLITPDGWLYLDSFENLREFLLKNSRICRIVDLPDGIFYEATVKTAITLLERCSLEEGRKSNAILVSSMTLGNIVPELSCLQEYLIEQEIFRETYKHIFDLSLRPEIASIKRKISLAGISLGQITLSNFGIKTGDDTVFLRRFKQTDEDRPILRGANIGRYQYSYSGEFVWYVPEKMIAHKSTARPGEAERFQSPKILIRDTAEKLYGTFDDEQFYVKDVLILRSLDNNYDLCYILAILNSSMMQWYYETSFPTLHVQRNELASLPIRVITRLDSTNRNIQPCNEVLRQFLEDNGDENFSTVLNLVSSYLRQQPEMSVVIHDLLTCLAKQMVNTNKIKTAKISELLVWLEDQVNVVIDELDGKSKLQNFLGDYQKGEVHLAFEELLAVLVKNKRKLTVDPSEHTFRQALERRYTQALDELLPLKRRLELTDRLIDQIVYKLYGLSEEEIAIVEERK